MTKSEEGEIVRDHAEMRSLSRAMDRAAANVIGEVAAWRVFDRSGNVEQAAAALERLRAAEDAYEAVSREHAAAFYASRDGGAA